MGEAAAAVHLAARLASRLTPKFIAALFSSQVYLEGCLAVAGTATLYCHSRFSFVIPAKAGIQSLGGRVAASSAAWGWLRPAKTNPA
jgi:hypothetical protein